MAEINPNNSQRKLFKISLVANAIILNIFLLAHLLIDPFNSNIEYAVTSWTIFILSLVSVNFLLYKYFKKYLEKRIHGWLPKEPHSSGSQRITNHKSPRIRLQIGIVAFVMGFAGGLLGAFGVSLGLFSGLGVYVWPILIGIAWATVAATIVIQKKKNEERERMTQEVKT
jgi:hypothetical protein